MNLLLDVILKPSMVLLLALVAMPLLRGRSAALSPKKKSSISAPTTCHCSGLVSCPSSTRMWLRPASSLYRTQVPWASSCSRAASFSIRSSKSSSERARLARS